MKRNEDRLFFLRFLPYMVIGILCLFASVATCHAQTVAVEPPDKGKATEDISSADFVYDSKDKRDPFAPPGRGKGGIEEIQNLKLDGVISDKNGMCAVISGQIVKKGDRLFDAEVVDISKESVILQYKKERIELKMSRPEDEKQTKEE